jgi:hypothetical protein
VWADVHLEAARSAVLLGRVPSAELAKRTPGPKTRLPLTRLGAGHRR